MAKTDRCVVRNQAYRRGEFSIRERHNERKNISYGNGDIIPGRSSLNVQFKSCPATYEQEFSRMVDSGEISLRGLKQGAKVFDELIFDVNSAYFENHGGYDYAKEFFAEAYRLAVKEAGGEQYILSAVLHADERNKALSDQMGRDVFHYHLHVVYVPVVDKEIRWTKRCKDPALVGTVKEVVKQVSHSKKWPRYKDEKGAWINSYSLLQDRFFEHMRAAGFTDFERGVRGSTAEHLSVLDYKIQQDESRADLLDKRVKTAERQLTTISGKLAVTKQAAATVGEIEGMGRKTIGGNIQLSPADWKTLSGLAKEGVKSRESVKRLKEKSDTLTREVADLKARLSRYGEGVGITDAMQFYQAKQRAPRRMAALVDEILHQPPEQAADKTTAKKRNQEQSR